MTSSRRLSRDDVLDRVNTGIQAFDDLVMGGLPRGRATVVAGSPGSGKTVFAMQFLAHGITDNDEPGVFVTFEEPWVEIAGNMASFGWAIQQWRDDKKLSFVDASPRDSDEMVVGDFDLSALLARIKHACDHVRAKRVVLDSVTQLFDHFVANDRAIRRELLRIASALKRTGLTMSGHRGSPRRAPEASPPALNPSRKTRSALSL